MEYTLIREKRKTIMVKADFDGKIVVKAPLLMLKSDIDAFIEKNSERIEKMRVSSVKRGEEYRRYDRAELIKRGKEILSVRLPFWEEKTGLVPKSVKITSAKGRYGSCSAKGNICFSMYLFTKSDDEIDYVIVHELVHLKELNHSKAFYGIVEKYIPDYKAVQNKLRRKNIDK